MQDFNEALHKYLGLVWDPKNPTICDGAAREAAEEHRCSLD